MHNRIYLSMRPLTGRNYPARIVRAAGVSLVVCDPRATKPEVLMRLYDLYEPWEHEQTRRAYGQPPVGERLAQSLTEGQCLPYVPPSLRVPGEPRVQNPDLESDAGRRAYLDALEWERLEVQMMAAAPSRAS